MKKLVVDLHIIQSFPTSNINRDAVGTPKMAHFGGAPRNRWSSQAQKRPVRLATEQALGHKYSTFRSKRGVDELAKNLITLGVDTDDAALAARNAFEKALGIGLKDVEDGADEDGTKRKRPATNVLLFIGRDELERMAQHIRASLDEFTSAKISARTKRELFKEFNGRNSAGVALTGRFIAKQPELRIDGAVSVAHALSTHRSVIDHDYYVAMDDLQPDDASGADMIGTIDLTSSTLYRYATVDATDALKNLHGDLDLTRLAVLEFLKQFIMVRPASMARGTAPYTYPQFVGANLRVDGAPMSLINAFEQPISSKTGVMVPSIRALDAHHNNMKRAFDLNGTSIAYADGVTLNSFDPAESSQEVLDAISAFLDENLKEPK